MPPKKADAQRRRATPVPAAAPAAAAAARRDDEQALELGASDAAPAQSAKAGGRAWHDDDDDDAADRAPAFVRIQRGEQPAGGPAKPSWAQRRRARDQAGILIGGGGGAVGAADYFEDSAPANAAAANRRKRGGDDDNTDLAAALLGAALVSTEPVLTSLSTEATILPPRPSSTIMLPQEKIRDLAWHPTSSLLCVTTSRMVHTFHVSGKFTEKMTSWRVPGKGLSQSAMLQRGERLMLLGEDGFVPMTVDLATGNVDTLNFLDFRSSTSAVFAVRGTATDAAPTVLATRPGDEANEIVAIPAGSRLHVASVRHGTMLSTITAPGVITDAIFTSDTEIAVAVPGSTVLFYDVRRDGRCVRKLHDPALLSISRLSVMGSNLVVGTTDGIVSTYSLSGTGATVDPTPLHTFKNLTTHVDLLACGKTSRRSDTGSILFGSSAQKSGFRLATLPDARVVPKFPSIAMNHQFISCVAFSSGAADPTVSVGEYGRIINYAC